MLRICFAFLSAFQLYSQQHIFQPDGPLSSPLGANPVETAEGYVRSHAADIGITRQTLDTIYLHKNYRTEHNGVTHVTFRQRVHGLAVHNAEWIVNVDRDGAILSAGGQLYDAPEPVIPVVTASIKAAALASAKVNPRIAQSYYPFQSKEWDGSSLSFHRGAFGADLSADIVWYGFRGALKAAWKFRIVDNEAENVVIVDGSGSEVLHHDVNLYHQSPQGLVYEIGPITNPKPGFPREGPAQFTHRIVVPFTGDPIASPKGWVEGSETAGNNTVAGTNRLGSACRQGIDNCPFPPDTAKSGARDFSFPLETGPDAPQPTSFPEASSTNLFYLVNRAHDLFYLAGFDEAAGNFQKDNFGKGGIGGDPVYAYALYGSAGAGFAQLNNAGMASSENDGTPATMRMFVNYGLSGQQPGFFTDGSLDAETVFHEYAHGVSMRLASRLYTTFQGRAMGEAISDFFALEFTLAPGAPVDGVYPFAEFIFFQPDRGIRTRPYSTRMEINPLTYAQLGHVILQPQVHADGEIFMQALWEVRANLITQFGETEGRRRVRLLAVDMLKLAPPQASMLDMRDALLLADRTGFRGQSQEQIWAGFAKRGMGILAQTGDATSLHISANFDRPSDRAAIGMYEPQFTIGESVRVVLYDRKNPAERATVALKSESGDLEYLTLRRKGAVFLGQIPTFYPPALRTNGVLEITPADSITASYDDATTGAGVIQTSAYTAPDYTLSLFASSPPTAIATVRRLGLSAQSTRVVLPFEFPFFEKKYSDVRVYQSGVLVFGGVDFTPCTDIASLRQIPAVAPMWTLMRVTGNVQQGEDVYISSVEDSISFQWRGETIPTVATQSAGAVNFGVELFSDGRILFTYGPGNQNLGAGGQQINACPNSTVTVGISSGHEAFVQLARTHDGLPSLENAPALLWEPPFANRGGTITELESPREGENAQGTILVQGIAYDADTSVRTRRIDILIDGRNVTNAGFGAQRPDYCRGKQIPQCPAVGFRRLLDAREFNIAEGNHTIQLRATNTHGVVTVFPERPLAFTVSSGSNQLPSGTIETPASGAVLSGNTIVRGYVSAPNILITAVDVLIDGLTYGRAAYNIARPEVCATMAQPAANCPAIGFQFPLNTRSIIPPLGNGDHLLQVRVQDETGRFTLIPDTPVPFRVNDQNVDPPKGVLAMPVHNASVSGTMRISGHAWDPAGRITSVLLIIDEEAVASIPYGRPRPEECAELTGTAACPNIGFEMDFDTRRLVNGPHVLSVIIINDRGAQLRVPLTVSSGINITVNNP